MSPFGKELPFLSYQAHQLRSTVGKVRNTNSLPICYELDPRNKTTYAIISKIHSHPETKFKFHFSFTLYPALSLALRCQRAPEPGPRHSSHHPYSTADGRHKICKPPSNSNATCPLRPKKVSHLLLSPVWGHSCTSRLSETIQAVT